LSFFRLSTNIFILIFNFCAVCFLFIVLFQAERLALIKWWFNQYLWCRQMLQIWIHEYSEDLNIIIFIDTCTMSLNKRISFIFQKENINLLSEQVSWEKKAKPTWDQMVHDFMYYKKNITTTYKLRFFRQPIKFFFLLERNLWITLFTRKRRYTIRFVPLISTRNDSN